MSAAKCMMYGKLGRYAINITAQTRLVSFWINLILGKETKLSKVYCDEYERQF